MMAENSLSVKIVADITDVPTKLAVIKAELSAAASAAQKTAKAWVGASEEEKGALAAKLQAEVTTVTAIKVQEGVLRAELAKTAAEGEVSRSVFAKINENVLGLGEQAEAVTGKISAFTGAFGKIGELAAVGFGAEVIGEQISKTAELGEAYAQLAEKTGATMAQMGGLRLAAMETGTDFDTVGNGVRELGQKMQDALIHPAGDSAQAFHKLGVSISDSNGQLLPAIDVFQQIAEKLATFQDGTAKTALASDVLGAKFGSTLIPVLNQVGDGFDTLQGKAQAYGLTMSQDEVEASERFAQSQKDMQAALIGLRTEIVGPLLGAFGDIESALANNVLESQEVKSAAAALSITFAGVVDVGVAMGTAIAEVTSVAFTLGETMGVVATEVLAAGEAMTGHLALALQIAKNGVDELKTSWVELGESIETNEKLFSNVTTDLISGATGDSGLAQAVTMMTLADHQGAGEQPAPQLSPDIPKSGGGDRGAGESSAQDQITQIANAGAEARKSIQESELQAQIATWQTEVAEGKLSKATEIQDEIAAQDQIYAAALEEAQGEVALAPQGSVARAKALDDEQVLMAQHVATMAQLNEQLVEQQVTDAQAKLRAEQQAAEQAQAAWQKIVQPVETAMDGMLNGILQGTQTLKGAEIKVAQDITLAFIDSVAKKTLAAAAGEAQILATHLGFQAAGKSADAAASSATIMNNAHTAASGAFAAVAGIPYVGPVLAPVAGAAAFAAVLSYDVLSAEGGLALGPGMNPLVQLHENEMVLPSHIATPLQAMLGGDTYSQSGGDTNTTNHFNTTVNSGAGGASSDDILSVLNNAARNGSFPARYSALNRMMRRGI